MIINGTRDEYLDDLNRGILHGTLFKKKKVAITSKKHWMLYILPSRGRIFVDDGAARALMSKGASLLPSGVVDVEGEFTNGDAVDITGREGSDIREIAKGLTQYGSRDLAKIQGKQSSEIEAVLGYFFTDVVVHRDDMVLRTGGEAAKGDKTEKGAKNPCRQKK
jgi:glutamate 5-kinase